MGSAVDGSSAEAQSIAFKRTVLLKADLSCPDREVVQALVQIPDGVNPGKHTHPGEEIAYVLEGTRLLSAMAKILATYMVEKGQPLAMSIPY